jgi:hypothetical protein
MLLGVDGVMPLDGYRVMVLRLGRDGLKRG